MRIQGSNRAALLWIVLLAAAWWQFSPVSAADNFDGLVAEIRAANSGSDDGTITLSRDVILTAPLPPITGEIAINGGGHSISGNDALRVFDVNGGTLTLRNVTLSGGKAERGGAILLRNGARVVIEYSSLVNNRAIHGGAIATSGSGDSLTIHDSSFTGNRAEDNAGAIFANGGTLRVVHSSFEKNCAVRVKYGSSDFGAAETDKLEVDSDGCLRLTQHPSGADKVLSAEGKGGAIRLLNEANGIVERSVFRDNRATYGGAISTDYEFARLSVGGSSFISNLASQGGGAIYALLGATTISNSSFVKNAASSGGAVVANAGQVDIANSTFGENRATTGAGALAITFSARVRVRHGTFFGNRSGSRGASTIERDEGTTLYLSNSIIVSRGEAEDCIGGFTQNIGNISPDGTCGIKASGEPLLGKLTGSPAYYPLLDHSPALDAADPDDCPNADQLGTARPLGRGCDSGAIESNAELPPAPIIPPPNCTLADQIIAANTDQPFAACPAGNGADTIVFTRDLILFAPLPAITSDITIEGNGFSIDGDLRFRIFDVDGGHIIVNDLTMTRGWPSSGGGGAIRLKNGARATVNNSSFIGNLAEAGGALALGTDFVSSERFTISNSRFIGNQAMRGGGAINLSRGSAEISASSFVRNSAGRGGGAINLFGNQQLTVTNSSFINNVADWGGGALSAQNGATATLTHVTIYNDVRFVAGSAIRTHVDSGGNPSQVNFRNSIIAGLPHYAECQAELAQNIANLIADGSCSPALSGDAKLQAPTDVSAFLAPLRESPAIGAADPRYCPPEDQIGNPRPQDGACDIGAIQAVPTVQALSDCRVTTTHGLNFRYGPQGKIIGSVPVNTTLPATARTPGWFQVEYRGASGWVSADYAASERECG